MENPVDKFLELANLPEDKLDKDFVDEVRIFVDEEVSEYEIKILDENTIGIIFPCTPQHLVL